MKTEMRRRIGIALAACALAVNYSPWVQAALRLPDTLHLTSGETVVVNTGFPMLTTSSESAVQVASLSGERLGDVCVSAVEDGEASVTFSLLGLFPVHETKVSVAQERMLIPGGQVVGVALKTQGVLVVGKTQRDDLRTPLKAGDVILSVGGVAVDSAKALSEQVNEAAGDAIELAILRGEKEMSVEVSAPVDATDGKRRLGVWVRDSTAGVGTLSYIDPQTNAYGALGHAIVDADTGEVLTVRDGAVMRADVVGVTPGEIGRAGELRGSFLKDGVQIGSLDVNTSRGIYGTMDELPPNLLYPQGLPVGSRSTVKTGPATIISTVDENGPQEYSIEILRCYDQDTSGQKNMLLRVTDERLLAATGGIVQGMSGSPIIQDGKLIGAVTHVLVNDPTRGYGIFIENMLDAAG